MEEGVIAFDIDGVLANFTRGFTRIGHQLFGTPVGDSESQQTWMFEDFPSLSLDKPKCDGIWAVVKSSPDFWAMLDPKNVSVMSRINRIANKVFITNRPGVNPITQSEHFLETWGIQNPRVIIASEKGEVAKREHVVAVIDDLNVNVIDIKKFVPDCYAALLYCNYNKIHHEEWLYQHIGEIVLSVDEFIDQCYARGLIRETVDDDNADARIRAILATL